MQTTFELDTWRSGRRNHINFDVICSPQTEAGKKLRLTERSETPRLMGNEE